MPLHVLGLLCLDFGEGDHEEEEAHHDGPPEEIANGYPKWQRLARNAHNFSQAGNGQGEAICRMTTLSQSTITAVP